MCTWPLYIESVAFRPLLGHFQTGNTNIKIRITLLHKYQLYKTCFIHLMLM